MKAPAFQFYVRDWILSRAVQKMSGDEVKAYVYLLSESWLETPRATIPDDDEELARMAQLSQEKWQKVKAKVMANFVIINGRWTNEKLLGISANQSKFKKWGLMGGNPNLVKNKESEPKEVNPMVNGEVNPTLNPLVNLATASASATASNTLNTRRAFTQPKASEVTEYAKSIGFVLDGEYFIDKYTANGWMCGKSKMKDWKATVRTWKKNNFKSNGEISKPHSIEDHLKAQGVK